jgi:hypothetical protein
MSLKKIAFFVEGYTEQIFVEKLLIAIFAEKDIAIDVNRMKGGKNIPISITNIKSSKITVDTKYFVLIYNCGGDSNIKSYILERRNDLLNAGYVKIIGLRDIYPDFTRSEIHQLKYGLNYRLPQKDIKIEFIISIMEIESWFLAEHTHYPKIHPELTVASIKDKVGIDFSDFNTELLDTPATMLNDIYQIEGESYDKSAQSITRTINSLNYEDLYFETRKRINCLDELIKSFEEIFE